jgi:hypothetical protein
MIEPMPYPTEKQLDAAFALKAEESPQFAQWVVNNTRFGKRGPVRLMSQELAAARSLKFWWRHVWCRAVGDKETDIFLPFEVLASKQRFALHIENKRINSDFEDDQPELYRARADHLRHNPKYLSYTDFATMIIAPRAFRDRYRARCDLFDAFIPHEGIAQFVPEFGLEIAGRSPRC